MVVFNFGRVHFATIGGNAYQKIKCPWPKLQVNLSTMSRVLLDTSLMMAILFWSFVNKILIFVKHRVPGICF